MVFVKLVWVNKFFVRVDQVGVDQFDSVTVNDWKLVSVLGLIDSFAPEAHHFMVQDGKGLHLLVNNMVKPFNEHAQFS